ncbi:hypothetical protein GGH91_003436 [Coemansia sp. RSA 2671]|uniref:ER membrane protein complex subunit 6 n=2 Tax=Coemansia TaxID=4863 RepID=A0A9W8GR78_9FUNG|nr:hypothetical protein LPJ60_003636 [Coemansia sp. RSA 2675]KAJ2017925.1 hypothetical protein GGI06_002806 [Coemansia sp. S85]KAJ2026154.1 hypothetical protein IWW57_003133 [Coemansia sp. S610]KAJ2342704.1 hypothetical protein GGH91_003436 [Coemansia sp. RSA 2671]KAJ2490537.1 hypothetical protein IWW37_003097 [Coemansia sp. RSA 2050]KAJ2690414.1 hypothetical protein IWW39_000813 [Coemansia spiralis]KAJ2736438.1 hypothetical protein IW152_000799 [Coemansia sp. BCRC 34962]KAJ2779860.1 hypothe
MADQADVYKYYEPTVQLNNLALSNIHTLASWGVGTAAGILGLTGWNGFIFFVINWIAISALVFFVKCKGDSSVYFKSSFMDVAGTPMFNTLLSYVLVWTLMHALVYIYD